MQKTHKLILGSIFIFTATTALIIESPSDLSMFRKKSVLAAANDNESTANSKQKWTNPFSVAVLRLKVTEPRFSSSLNGEKRPGRFDCAGCGTQLFTSEAKYDSGSGWPSFTRPVSEGSVILKTEWGGRNEVSCRKCGGHQGHVFPDGPSAARGGTGMRYCVNGLALDFSAAPSDE
mmetsp:Transcript_58339/g.117193  ORF Transcript_58339/g.117193 Transcript_58339/m.117193 type:complete len:176 (+) Transcript_58339:52-579(+)|eukprot:CAMPEP_0171912740 /NCGR_PEP_ID=MMETSP0993-20121228/11334_1 /TAXON_ID=483369 /ORGANISM="non described non described, Strain CCMP2098" /LENGTH=175 /DNA_ID=CAMNT_0012546641 /DNA_START=54 /DNA_END=581 /DNA_ORIENTATION=+